MADANVIIISSLTFVLSVSCFFFSLSIVLIMRIVFEIIVV